MIDDTARVLFILGALFALAGPAVAVIRTAVKYSAATKTTLTHTAVKALVDPDVAVPAARRDAWWAVAEFAAVGLGVALTAVASLILIP